MSSKTASILVKCLEEDTTTKPDVDIFEYTSRYSFDVSSMALLGFEANAQGNRDSSYPLAVESILKSSMTRYTQPWFHPNFLWNLTSIKKERDRQLEVIHRFAKKAIGERMKYLEALNSASPEERAGIKTRLAALDPLLQAKGTPPMYLEDIDIQLLANAGMFAGYETVSTALGWSFAAIGSNPKIQECIVEELVEVFGDSGRPMESSDLGKLKYLERCIKEALRLYPSAPAVERFVPGDTKLENYTVPAKTNVIIFLYAIQRDPEYYPEPDKFDPDRFLPENMKGRHPCAFIPFSAGFQDCVGQKYAIVEMKMCISTVLRRFRIETVETVNDMKFATEMVLRPKRKIHVKMLDRSSHPHLRVKTT